MTLDALLAFGSLMETFAPQPNVENEGIESLLRTAKQDQQRYDWCVISMLETGIGYRAETECSCKIMAEIMGDNSKAMPLTEFVAGLKKLAAEVC
jgi:hypothetical protein